MINKQKLSASKPEIIKKISKNFPNIFQKDIAKLLDIVLFEITKSLSNGERVELRDSIGTFETRKQKKRISLNPRTLDRVEVPEKKSIIYKCSKEWKVKINVKK